MNKIHRIVWSEARQAFVVAHERVATCGKPSSTRSAITQAVTAALLSLGAGQALAVSDCNTHGTIVFDGTVSTVVNHDGVCDLANGDVLTVTGSMIQNSTRDLDNFERSPLISAPAVYLAPGISASSITIGSTGTLSGNAAIQIGKGTLGGTLSGNIVNAGQIIGKDGTAIAVAGDSTGTWSAIGNIINSATGTISGDSIGIHGVAFVGNGITNSGLIKGSSSASTAIDLNTAILAGSIVNLDGGVVRTENPWVSHDLSAAIAISVENSQFRSFENASLVRSLDGGAVFFGTNIITDGITNSGTLEGRYGLNAYGSDIRQGITNTGTMAGTAGTGWAGLAISNSTISGGITNTGLISADGTGMSIYDNAAGQSIAGDIVNSGTIQGGYAGISLYGPAAVLLDGSLVNTGLISGNTNGIVLTRATISGGIVNSGQIVGGIYSLKSNATSPLTVNNTGLIAGRLNLLGNSTINNAGVVALGLGVSTMSGTFNNLAPTADAHGGILRMPVATLASYAKLTVSGTVNMATGSVMDVQLARTHNVTVGGTLAGVMNATAYTGLFAGNNITTGIHDNSVLFDFIGIKNGNALDLVVLAGAGDCAGPISTARTGPCEVGFDSTSKALTVASNGSVTNGDIGVHFLSGLIGADNASLTNAGSISGHVTGLRIDAGTLSGGISNSGTISGGSYAIATEYGVQGNISNSGMVSGRIDVRGSGNFANSGTVTLPVGLSQVAGNFSNTGTFSATVTDSTKSQLLVGGTLTLGGHLYVDAVSMTAGHSYSNGTVSGLITAVGGRTGEFATYEDNSLLFNFTPVYGSNVVGLRIAAAAPKVLETTTALGNTPASGAAAALDGIITADPTGPIATLFQRFTTGQEQALSDAVTQTLPLLTGGSQIASSAALSGINRVIQARQEALMGMSAGDEFYGDKKFWMKPFGSWANQDDRKGVSGYDARITGLAIGADATLSNTTRVGVSFAYAKAKADSSSNVAPNSAEVDVFQLIGYGSYALDPATEINFQAGIGQNRTDGQRRIVFLGETAKANYDSLTATVGAGIGRTYAWDEKTSITPSIRADYSWMRDQGYTEKGSSANLAVKARSADELIVLADGKVTRQLESGGTLMANLGVGYDVLNKQASLDAEFAGAPGSRFTTKGLDPSPWLVRGGVGYVSTLTGGAELTLRYDVEYRQDFLNQTASVKARWAF